MDKILDVPLAHIAPDPEVPLFRGPIHNTTILQDSIRQDGVQQPLWVRKGSQNGTYYLFDGNRRLHAARRLGLPEVPCLVKEVDGDRARQLALVASQQEKFPDIVLDEGGNVVGGNCLAVKLEVDRPKVRRYQVASWLGITSDVAGALYRLYDESPDLKRAVEKGHIHITVYSLFKTAPQELKDYILTRKMPISAGRVRKILKEWDNIRARLLEETEETEISVPEPVNSIKDDVSSERPVSMCLNKAIQWLRYIEARPLSPTDEYLLEQLRELIEELDV